MAELVNADEFMELAKVARTASSANEAVSDFDLLASPQPEGGGPFGGRDSALTKLAGYLRAHGWSFAMGVDYALSWNQRWCDPPLEEHDVRQKFATWWAQWAMPDWKDLTPEGFQPKTIEREVLSVADLYEMEDQIGPIDFIIQNGIAKKKLHLLSGPPGMYKSWLAMFMGHSLTTGSPFLGRFVVPQGKCLWIDQEMGAQTMLARLKLIGFEAGQPFYMAIEQALRIDNPADVKWISDYCTENDIHMVVMDSMRRMHRKKSNDNDDVGLLIEPLRAIANSGPAVLLIAHDRKRPSGGESDVEGDATAGAGDQTAQVDMVFGLRRSGTRDYTLSCRKPRLCDADDALTVTFTMQKSQDGQRVWLEEVNATAREEEQRGRQNDLILANLIHGAANMDQLDKIAHWQKGTAKRVCDRLLEDGKIEPSTNQGRGKWVKLAGR